MAHTAHRDSKMMEEIRMTGADVASAAAHVAQLVRAAERVVFFTGAGLSTSCGIADYRGPTGVWTLAAQGRTRAEPTTPMHLADPSPAHMAIVEFQRRGKLSLLISQNVDGLHRRSGVDADNMCELHGNSNMEECGDCGKPHHRELHIHGDARHFTGRKCVACGGPLRDTIINFGENLSPVVLEKAFERSRTADLHICLGSSLTVSPACDLPRETKRRGGKVVICNLQRTPLDATHCDVRVHCATDDFMLALMTQLGWALPAYTVRRQVTLLRQRGVPSSSVSPDDDDDDDAAAASDSGAVGRASSTSGNSVRFCATAPGTDVPSSSFATVTLLARDGSSSAATRDFTVDARALDDVCPRFALPPPSTAHLAAAGDAATEDAGDDTVRFRCTTFYPERREPADPVVLVLPAGVDAATFFISWSAAGEGRVGMAPTPTGEPHVGGAGVSSSNNNNSDWTVRCEISPALVTRPNFAKGAAATRVAGIRDSAGQDYTGWFAVTPQSNCPHTARLGFVDGQTFDHLAPCQEPACGHEGENMMCTSCGTVRCGRHVKSHMLQHFEATRHAIVISMRDLSVWCYECDVYIEPSNPRVQPMHHLLYRSKFGTTDPRVLLDSAAAAAAAP